MIPSCSRTQSRNRGIPRESGDDPIVPDPAGTTSEYSPRERG